MEVHWTSMQRVMGEVLTRDEKPRDLWDRHEAMLLKRSSRDRQQRDSSDWT